MTGPRAGMQARTAAGEGGGKAGVGDTRRALHVDLVSNSETSATRICEPARHPLLWRDLTSAGDVNPRRSRGRWMTAAAARVGLGCRGQLAPERRPARRRTGRDGFAVPRGGKAAPRVDHAGAQPTAPVSPSPLTGAVDAPHPPPPTRVRQPPHCDRPPGRLEAAGTARRAYGGCDGRSIRLVVLPALPRGADSVATLRRHSAGRRYRTRLSGFSSRSRIRPRNWAASAP